MMALHHLGHAKTCLDRVRMLEAEHDGDRAAVGLARDPIWLQLPLAKRETALRRHRALVEYERIARPTVRDADAAAAGIGVGRRIFYRLLSDWRENGRSAFSLVPYRALAEPRRSKLPEAAVTTLREATRAVLTEHPDVALPAAVRLVVDRWPADVPRPTDVTIRNYLDRQLAEQPREIGTMSIAIASSRHALRLTANVFGEVLVIDHTAPARLRVLGDTAKAPTITLVMDLHTGVPVGASVTLAPPSPQGTLDALADARSRLTRRMKVGDKPPAIVSAMPIAAKWRSELAVLRDNGCRIIERGVRAARIGEMARRIVGPKLDELPLLAARAEEDGVMAVDLEQEALVSLREARLIVDAAIEKLIDERFPEDVAAGMSAPLLPEALAGRADLASLHAEVGCIASTGPTDADDGGRTSAGPTRERLRAMVQDRVGDDLAGLAIHDPTPGQPYWTIELRPSSSEIGHRIWASVVTIVAGFKAGDDVPIVVRLLSADA